MLFLFPPFQNENELKDGDPESYSQNAADQTLIDVINENKTLVEPYFDAVNEVIEDLQFHAGSDSDLLFEEHGPVAAEAEENETEEDDIALGCDQLVNANVVNTAHSVSNIENDKIINAKIHNLNIK